MSPPTQAGRHRLNAGWIKPMHVIKAGSDLVHAVEYLRHLRNEIVESQDMLRYYAQQSHK